MADPVTPIPDIGGNIASESSLGSNSIQAVTKPSTTAATGENVTGASTFSSLEDLRTRAPKIFQKMMEGISSNMIDQLKKGADRVKEAMRKIREDQ